MGKPGQKENKCGKFMFFLGVVLEFGHNKALSFLATEAKKTCPAARFTVGMGWK